MTVNIETATTNYYDRVIMQICGAKQFPFGVDASLSIISHFKTQRNYISSHCQSQPHGLLWADQLTRNGASLFLLGNCPKRRSNKFQLVSSKVEDSDKLVPIFGPYTKKWRKHWLRQVLTAQVQARQNAPEDMKAITLITPEELSEIRRIWREEKHEFDDSLPRIYREVTKEIFRVLDQGLIVRCLAAMNGAC